MSNWDISYCGLNCAKCGLRAQGECAGCRGSQQNHWTPDCHFMRCADERAHEYCFECNDFPCQDIEDFRNDGHDHHRIAIENLESMREIGLDRWIESQPKVMFCPGWVV